MSSSAIAAIDFTDDFEGYALGPDANPIGDWKVFAAVYNDYTGCSAWIYQYGPFPAPNSASAFSNITVGSSGQALNVFSDYDNGDQANDKCIETSLFQEVSPFDAAADAGTYEFLFYTEVPAPLGTGVSTFGFVKLLDPNNGYNADIFETVSTVTGGTKSITVTLDGSAQGKILQWGYSTIASDYQASGRLYDNVSFALEGTYQPPTGSSPIGYDGIPIPRWALLIMAGLLVYLGGKKLRVRKEI